MLKTWDAEKVSPTPLETVVCKNMVTGISHARYKILFVKLTRQGLKFINLMATGQSND